MKPSLILFFACPQVAHLLLMMWPQYERPIASVMVPAMAFLAGCFLVLWILERKVNKPLVK